MLASVVVCQSSRRERGLRRSTAAEGHTLGSLIACQLCPGALDLFACVDGAAKLFITVDVYLYVGFAVRNTPEHNSRAPFFLTITVPRKNFSLGAVSKGLVRHWIHRNIERTVKICNTFVWGSNELSSIQCLHFVSLGTGKERTPVDFEGQSLRVLGVCWGKTENNLWKDKASRRSTWYLIGCCAVKQSTMYCARLSQLESIMNACHDREWLLYTLSSDLSTRHPAEKVSAAAAAADAFMVVVAKLRAISCKYHNSLVCDMYTNKNECEICISMYRMCSLKCRMKA